MFGFLPIVFIVYYLVPQRFKNAVLAASGLFFYGWGEPVYLLLMMFTIAVDYAAGRIMERFDSNQKLRFRIMLTAVILNLGVFGVFKYTSFFVENINGIFGLSLPDPKLALPIGISFYTFQAMSYVIDLYRRDIRAQRSIVNFAGYVSMFPQLIAGPIVRYSDVEEEMYNRSITADDLSDGITIFIRGLGKKVLLANNIGAVWTAVKAMDYSEISALTAWVGIIAFSFQIFFDFGGYSDMAIGLGRMLGFHFPQNFNLPYLSKSITEFWRRWHMTLGSWFRSYVYIPLGGNRTTKLKHIRNILIVWGLTGLWHGASWNFVLWGLYFGVILLLEKFVYGKLLEKAPAALRHIYALLLILFGWVLFEMNAPAAIGGFIGAMFGMGGRVIDNNGIYLLVSNLLLFVLCAACSTSLPTRLRGWAAKRNVVFEGVSATVCSIVILAVSVCYLITSQYNPFLYLNF